MATRYTETRWKKLGKNSQRSDRIRRTVGDQINPEQLHRDEALWNAEHRRQEDGSNLYVFGLDRVMIMGGSKWWGVDGGLVVVHRQEDGAHQREL